MEDHRAKKEVRICPLCGRKYMDHPALSRIDNETLICPDCSTKQALSSIGISPNEQEKILEIIHSQRT